jgi:hypothetical protein
MRAQLAVVVLLAACGKSGGKPVHHHLADEGSGSGHVAARQLSESACRTQATAVGDLLVAAAQEPPSWLSLPAGLQLVQRTDLAVRRDLRSAPSVVLTPDRATVDDVVVADLDVLETELHAQFEKVQRDLERGIRPARRVPEPRLVYFAIAPDTPWQRVTGAVSAAARAGFEAPAFVFEQPQTLKPAPRAPIDDQIDAIQKLPPSDRAVQIAKLVEKLIDRCPPLQKAFGAVGVADEEDKAMTLARAVAPSLIECRCDVDLAALRSVMFRVIYVARPLRMVAFDPAAAKEQIVFPPQTTWAKASQRFTPSLRNAALIAR